MSGGKKYKELRFNIPESLQTVIQNEWIVSIIQFGSSLRKSNPNDIDLAIVIRKGCYEKFLGTVCGEKFKGFDISLIKEEEIQGPKKFRFGGHGAHFLQSLIDGKVLYGMNPFRKFKVTDSQVRNSTLSRLYDYVEDVRRAVFKGKIEGSIKRHWPKFLRLSLYLLDSSLEYPWALNLNEKEVQVYLKKHQIDINPIDINIHSKDLLVAYETIWSKVLEKYRLISPRASKKG